MLKLLLLEEWLSSLVARLSCPWRLQCLEKFLPFSISSFHKHRFWSWFWCTGSWFRHWDSKSKFLVPFTHQLHSKNLIQFWLASICWSDKLNVFNLLLRTLALFFKFCIGALGSLHFLMIEPFLLVNFFLSSSKNAIVDMKFTLYTTKLLVLHFKNQLSLCPFKILHQHLDLHCELYILLIQSSQYFKELIVHIVDVCVLLRITTIISIAEFSKTDSQDKLAETTKQ